MIGLGVGVDALARGYAIYGLLGRPGGLPAAMAVTWATNLTWILGIGLFPLALLLFPDGHPPTRRWRPLVWLILSLAVALPLEGVVIPGPMQVFRRCCVRCDPRTPPSRSSLTRQQCTRAWSSS